MKPQRLLLLATGGTIAGAAASAVQTQGYQPGAVPVERLVAAVPELAQVARIQAEQVYSIGSQHMSSSNWLGLATRIRDAMADPDIDGIVITHGTDTIEETALFLDLVCPRLKPIVLTGAMRPATAVGADGPMNLFAAARVAADPLARGAGAVVVMNDQVVAPHQACKAHTVRTDAFIAREGAPLALMLDARPVWRVDAGQAAALRPSLARQLTPLPSQLPRVDLLAQQVDIDTGLVGWLLDRGSRGIVVAGTGHGSLSKPLHEALHQAVAAGCVVARASRVAGGPVQRNGQINDDENGFVATGFLPPHKARLVIALGLAAGLDRAAIQDLLLQY
jgi:L-asparaginase